MNFFELTKGVQDDQSKTCKDQYKEFIDGYPASSHQLRSEQVKSIPAPRDTNNIVMHNLDYLHASWLSPLNHEQVTVNAMCNMLPQEYVTAFREIYDVLHCVCASSGIRHDAADNIKKFIDLTVCNKN